MCPLRLHVHGVKRLAPGHKQAVAFRSTEAEVPANLWQKNQSNTLAVRGEDMNAVVAFPSPTSTSPNIAIHIRANAVCPGYTRTRMLMRGIESAEDLVEDLAQALAAVPARA